MINLFVGFDQREAIAYHVFSQSVISKSSSPVSITPLALNNLKSYKETHLDGSNTFIYSRFLVPYLMNFKGWAIFADGDMICNEDISNLWAIRSEEKAIMCVKHNYKTKKNIKYLGNKNEDYPRKNWSSLMLWNCGHKLNSILTPDYIESQSGAFLHRMSWLPDELIGDIPVEWNWLADEYANNEDAKVVHYTLGTPCFSDYKNSPMSDLWHAAFDQSLEGMGQ
jgi:lipopolysaccharide biosynthesis glycosyltransferase